MSIAPSPKAPTPAAVPVKKADPANNAIVKKQFAHCVTKPTFFDDFYAEFTGRSPEIRQMFAKTDMSAQKAALRSGLSFLIMFAEGNSAFAAAKLDRLGQSHRRTQLNVRPELYPLWLQSLIKTVERHLPDFDESSRKAWKEILQLGVDRMVSHYYDK